MARKGKKKNKPASVTFVNDKLTDETMQLYKAISEKHNIPLRLVATLGATESAHGADKRIEEMGNTRGVFHITKGAALDAAKRVLKDKKLVKEIEGLSESEFRDRMFTDRELETNVAGGYIKMAYNRAKGDPTQTYAFYNAGVHRNLKKRPFNSLHMANQKRFSQRYEDSGNYMSRFTPDKSYVLASSQGTEDVNEFIKQVTPKTDFGDRENFVNRYAPAIDSASDELPKNTKFSFNDKVDFMSMLDPSDTENNKGLIKAIMDSDTKTLFPAKIDKKTPLLASMDQGNSLQVPPVEQTEETEVEPVAPESVMEEESVEEEIDMNDEMVEETDEELLAEQDGNLLEGGEYTTRFGGMKEVAPTTIEEDLENFTFEGMGDDIVNKFTDRNSVGFIVQAGIKQAIMDRKIDHNFNIEKDDKELFTQMTQGLDPDDVVELIDQANSRGDFIKMSSLMQGKLQRQKDMNRYSQEHPVLSGVNTISNILVEGAVFMPVGTTISAASRASRVSTLAALNRTRMGAAVFGESVEQGLQEYIWSQNDKNYEFNPILFGSALGMGVGLRLAYGTAEADDMFRSLVKNEKGFINISTNEGKLLVDEVSKNVTNKKAIALAENVAKKKTVEANRIRKNLTSQREALVVKLNKVKKRMKVSADPTVKKQLKLQKQEIARKIEKFDKKLPNEVRTLLNGTHPKLTAAVNPEFKLTTIAKELGIDPKEVASTEKLRKFLGLDQPNVDPNFVIEGEKGYKVVARQQLQEMSTNRRLNMNETLKYMAGTDTVKAIDSLPLIGKMQIGDKLNQIANTDGAISRFLFNKGNIVSSENELASSFYNWLAPDGMGRQGMSKIRAIESQQKYANIYGGDLLNMYHSHGSKIYEAINGKLAGAKGFFSVDDYEETIEPLLKERLLAGNSSIFREKYGNAIADAADAFYDDFNKLNSKIVARAKELGVEGVDFDATEGWFHRDWDFRKARSVSQEDLSETVFTAMLSHVKRLGVADTDINEAALRSHAKKFSFGLRNADLTTIEGLQSDHIKLLDKLVSKSEGVEKGVIKDEIARLKHLKSKADAGDLAHRVQMDVDVELPDGRKLSDLFEDNIVHTQKRYTARMAARIAAAEHGIKNLDTIDEWINDAVEMEIKKQAAKGVKNPKSSAEFLEKAMKQDFQSFKHGGMTGLYDLPDDSASDFIRFVKKYNYARLMQYTGISSIAELGGTFVEAGVSTTLGEMGRYMRNHFNDLYLDNPKQYTGRLYDELRTITGVGMEDFSFTSKGMSKASRIFESGLLNRAEKGVDVLGRIAQAPFGGIEKVGRRITVNSLAIKWANHFNKSETGGLLSAFFGSNGVTNRVLENSGFGSFNAGKFVPNKTYKDIEKSIKEFATFDNGRLVKLNLEKWDTKTAQSFGDAIQMQANHIMVSPDATTMALWQSSTIGQILNQFRTFTVNATTKVMGAQLANAAVSANRGDMSEMVKTGQKIFWGSALGMLSVTLRQGIQKAGGDEEIDLYDEGLIKAAAIGLGRSSIIGNIPTISDTISGSFGYDPVFEKTSSLGRSKNFFNLSTTPTGQAIGGVVTSGEKALQGDYKGSGMQLLKTSPVYRQIGAQQIFNFIDDEK